ncbi:MAG: hypothetical protein HC897_02570 [Thermoanaerobaculia bacterium]|nr:hypothetical protein [Thermoanaerobaculia bacterium]
MNSDTAALLINSATALGGISLGGLISLVILRVQLKNQAREQERERLWNLRRDVFLESAQAIAAAQMALGSIARQDLELGRVQEQLSASAAALSKFQLVASEQTLLAIGKYRDFFVSRSMDVLKMRFRADLVRDTISSQKDLMSKLEQRSGYLRTLREQLAGSEELREMAVVDLRLVQQELESAVDRMERLCEKQKQVAQELGQAVYQRLEAQEEVGEVVIQIRREIELPLEPERYKKYLKDCRERHSSHVTEMYGGFDDFLAELETL